VPPGSNVRMRPFRHPNSHAWCSVACVAEGAFPPPPARRTGCRPRSRGPGLLAASLWCAALGAASGCSCALEPSGALPKIAAQPSDQSVTVGNAATFAVAASGRAPFAYQWQRDGADIGGATSASYTTPSTTPTDDGATFQVVVTNSTGRVTSDAAMLTVLAAGTDVVTQHNDNARSGQNLTESVLTPANVSAATFGLRAVFPVDGKVDAQPLYLSALDMPGGGERNVLYVATEHDTVYALDADTGEQIWKVSMLGAGETPSDDRGCGQITPEIGVTATPVIDRKAGLIYVVAMSMAGGAYFQRLHALDIRSGAEMLGGPQDVQATYPGNGDNSLDGLTTFDPQAYKERAGLLLLDGTLYTGWASHCDTLPYNGWIIAFDAASLGQTAALNITPNGYGAGIWSSGAGLAADSAGNVYLLAGNGTFDTDLDENGFPDSGDFGNAFLKIATAGGPKVVDYFAISDTVTESAGDVDFGSGGALVLPDLVDSEGISRRLALGAGKDKNIYLVDRDSMGKFHPDRNSIWQEIDGALAGGVFSVPAYFKGQVYVGAVNDHLKAFPLVGALLATTAASQTPGTFEYPGTTPSVSANGLVGGIVWAAENGNVAVLHAYDASDLSRELYNSNQAGNGRDHFGTGNKFITPTVADGQVFVGTTSGVGVFGNLP